MKKTGMPAAILLGFCGAALAQTAPLVTAKVTKVEASAGKITLEHQKIPNLDMPAMTMVFKASDPAILNTIKAGDRVKFTADSVNGQITVTKIVKAR